MSRPTAQDETSRDENSAARPGDAFDMGSATSAVFAGRGACETNRQAYAETAGFFAGEIMHRLPARSERYLLVDLGTFKGELLQTLVEALPDYSFRTVGIDVNGPALAENRAAAARILASVARLPLRDGSADLAIARYVLQWNNLDDQKQMLAEMTRAVRHFALLEHNGPGDAETEAWREIQRRLFTGLEIPKLKREDCYYGSPDEIEQWLRSLGITHERLKSRTIEKLLDLYGERYALDARESALLRRIP